MKKKEMEEEMRKEKQQREQKNKFVPPPEKSQSHVRSLDRRDELRMPQMIRKLKDYQAKQTVEGTGSRKARATGGPLPVDCQVDSKVMFVAMFTLAI